MRFLHRFGVYRHILDPVIFAFITHAVIGPGLCDDLESLCEPISALFQRNIESPIIQWIGATSQAEPQAPTAQDVHRRTILGAANRIVEGQQTDVHSQPDPLRVVRSRGSNDQGRGHDREFGEKVQLR
jgi:hypothetical protein